MRQSSRLAVCVAELLNSSFGLWYMACKPGRPGQAFSQSVDISHSSIVSL